MRLASFADAAVSLWFSRASIVSQLYKVFFSFFLLSAYLVLFVCLFVGLMVRGVFFTRFDECEWVWMNG